MEYQNARRAAREAGYGQGTVVGSSHKMAARVLEGMKAALWRKGMAVDRMADKLITLFDAKTPKWNSFNSTWDLFEDAGTQLQAYDRIKVVLEPEPPRKLEIDVLVGVRRDESRQNETSQQWEERNKVRRTIHPERQALLSTGMAQAETSPVKSNGKSNGKALGIRGAGGDNL